MESNGSNKKKHEVRRPYQTPAVEESGGFERLVLACSHTPQDGLQGDLQCELDPSS